MKTDSILRRAKRTFKRIVKGKVFEKTEFGTGLGDYTFYGVLAKLKRRPKGENPAPTLLVIDADNNAPSELTAVRIYVGTESSQHRAERVLLWSIYQQRNSQRRYEIYLMHDLAGFTRRGWKTGFTAYRYAIPEFAGFKGRAIYNDVDQIYLDDPGVLFDQAMTGSGILALNTIDTSVMLIDCAALEGIWDKQSIATAPRDRLHVSMLEYLNNRSKPGELPPRWNARDHEYRNGESGLLHYTILHTQPWRPFPSKLKYAENENAQVWRDIELDADRNHFAPSWKYSDARNYYDMEDFFYYVR